MRAVRFHEFGGPEVLRLEEVAEPHAGPGQVRVRVHACGVNPADWKIRQGDLGGELPQGVGLEVSGVIDELGAGVSDVGLGDRVFGSTSGGAADNALLSDYARVPDGLDLVQAAALPVAVETATRGLDLLGVRAGHTLVINGAGGAVGTVATQLAIAGGATVIATTSEANAARLRGYGAVTTSYGNGLVERVAELAPGGVDLGFDMGPAGALPGLVQLTGDPGRVLTISDFANAAASGVRTTGPAGTTFRWDVLPHAASLAAQGELALPVQQVLPLEQVAEAQRLSQTGHRSGKLVLLVD
ncbi:NADP-dependent oxidoreductase [Modestobacter sp. VKM Ac-2978]|uniref:NADP-dependent oxidoreductase n=1 Tax=Modestobacter sp. VKM Ac-2978 TaxID=3004132 RepID=UPI0022A9FB95|nr:NADP-dependent oxidoreductase [Modestobacter sp. VKM Ac-2978]MCZ2850846.1 NADP-dependent oxidoreductase [Modestobacter sp. VKM Ac-2978]